ncbi:MAG TPA: hypothetical protein PK517_04080 [Nitrosomonas sp.]|nr:hypothetical protein [Nitrosomonas sp.]
MATSKIHLGMSSPRRRGSNKVDGLDARFCGHDELLEVSQYLIESIKMISDTEIKIKGIQILSRYLGDVEAERFIALIQQEPFDYTKWRHKLEEPLSLEEISRNAMALRKENAQQAKD